MQQVQQNDIFSIDFRSSNKPFLEKSFQIQLQGLIYPILLQGFYLKIPVQIETILDKTPTTINTAIIGMDTLAIDFNTSMNNR